MVRVCRESTGTHEEPATEDREANGQPERVGTGGGLASGQCLRGFPRAGGQRMREKGMRRQRERRLRSLVCDGCGRTGDSISGP